MARIGKEESEVVRIPERIFTDAEIQKFHDELQNFKVTEKLVRGETTYIDFSKYHQSKRTTTDLGVVFIRDAFGEYIRPTRYERLEVKIRAYKAWCGRQEFRKEMELQHLEDISLEQLYTGEEGIDEILLE